MKNNNTLPAFVLFFGITVLYFYRLFFFFQIPFPGDLLVAEYAPWKYESYLGFVPGSVPHKAQYFDVIRQLYPWKTFAASVLRSGDIPLWNPYNFSGSPLLANIQSAVFYPFTFLFLGFSQPIAWSVFVILQPLLAAFFTYLFCRKIGISLWGSVLSGVSFGFSLFMSVFLEYGNIGHVILWLPLCLYAVERFLARVSAANLFLLTFGTSMLWLAGHLQLAGLSAVFLLTYIAFRVTVMEKGVSSVIWKSVLSGAAVVLGTGIAAPQLIPTFELIANSARVAQEHEYLVGSLLVQPFELIRIFSPDIFGNPAARNYLLSDPYPGKALYVGLIPACFALLSLFIFRKNKIVAFFATAWTVILLGILRTPLAEAFYTLEIPFVSSSSPGNSIFLMSFCVAVLSGFGIDMWLKNTEKKTYAGILLFVLILFAVPLLISGKEVLFKNALYTTVLLIGFITVFLFGKKVIKHRSLLAFLFITVTVFDLFYFFQKFNPFVDRTLIFPQNVVLEAVRNNGTDRFWGYGSGYVEANFATQYALFAADGYDPLYLKRYGAFLHASSDGRILKEFNNRTRSDAVIAKGYGPDDIRQNPARLRIMDALGVRYVLTRSDDPSADDSFQNDRYRIIYDMSGWRVYENLRSTPRAFLAKDFAVFRSDREFEEIFFSENFSSRESVLLEKEPQGIAGEGGGTAAVISYSPNEVVIETEASRSSLLVLSDTHYPGWKSDVDGTAVPIYRANYAFRAVVVPEGTHTVRFFYEPESFSNGVKTSIISLVALLGISIWLQKKVRYEK